jgi:type II secretory pathway component PulF
MGQVTFHFKAATGNGAVIDGTVVSSNSGRVAKDLMKQGLIPVRIWPERQTNSAMSFRTVGRLVGSLVGKTRAILHV